MKKYECDVYQTNMGIMILLPHDIHIERLAVKVLEFGVLHVKALVNCHVSKSIFFNGSNFKSLEKETRNSICLHHTLRIKVSTLIVHSLCNNKGQIFQTIV